MQAQPNPTCLLVLGVHPQASPTSFHCSLALQQTSLAKITSWQDQIVHCVHLMLNRAEWKSRTWFIHVYPTRCSHLVYIRWHCAYTPTHCKSLQIITIANCVNRGKIMRHARWHHRCKHGDGIPESVAIVRPVAENFDHRRQQNAVVREVQNPGFAIAPFRRPDPAGHLQPSNKSKHWWKNMKVKGISWISYTSCQRKKTGWN